MELNQEKSICVFIDRTVRAGKQQSGRYYMYRYSTQTNIKFDQKPLQETAQ